jgi:hypothetical protein
MVRRPGFATAGLTVIRWFLVAGLVFAPLGVGAVKADTVLESGPQQVALVELYTSQGCSSCPPADRWMTLQKSQPELWKSYVPLALHVDYWDYIGWQDPFAQPAFGQRQRVYEDEGSVNAVYTPGMMLDGREWRGWARDEVPASAGASAGVLTVVVKREEIQVTFLPQESGFEQLRVHVAILGFDLKSKVTRGENRGRELLNDFIVLLWADAPLEREADQFTAVMPSFTTGPVNTNLAIAAWIEQASQQTPLQAVGGWLPAGVADQESAR